MCGEKERWPAIRTASLGSPPRVRGKVKNATGIDAFSGITPACAGKRFVWFGLTPDGQDHPRVCGEKSKTLRGLMHFLGSPPRVRGKDDPCFSFRDNLGITPACAGKSVRLVEMFLRHGDHPRVCGEKDPVFPGLLLHLGSPPRVRGKEFWGCCCAGCHRITPACAGKSCNLSGVLCQFRDHPRVCGEKSGKLSLAHRSKGSPPRVRGKGKKR